MFSYKTLVRISPEILARELAPLKEVYDLIDPQGKRETHDQRSAFSRWNNLNHFYLRLTQQESPYIPILETRPDGSLVFEVTAAAKGNTSRIYFTPSVTSLTKEIRKAILPIDDNSVFVSCDIKAAEFALRCVQAGEAEALAKYTNGDDIYMHYSHLFPDGTARSVIKKILIANMYGQTAYAVGKDLGISETQAQRLLDQIASSTPRLTLLKRKIAAYAQRCNGYFSPDGFNQDNLIKVGDISGEFNPNKAYSAYTQSALGFIFQKFSNAYLNHQKGKKATFLTIFDSVVAEISSESLERFKEFFCVHVAPLQPDKFLTGKTMYEAMYGNN